MKRLYIITSLVLITATVFAQVPYRQIFGNAIPGSMVQQMKASKAVVGHSGVRDLYQMYVDYDFSNADDLYYVWNYNSGYLATQGDTAVNYAAVVLNYLIGYTDPTDPSGTAVDWSYFGLDDSFPDNVQITIDSVFVGFTHENNSGEFDKLNMKIVKTLTNGTPSTVGSGILWQEADSVDYGISPSNDWLGELNAWAWGPELTIPLGARDAVTLEYDDATKLDTLGILGGAVDDGTGGTQQQSLFQNSYMRYTPFIPNVTKNANIFYDTNGNGQQDPGEEYFSAQNWIYWFLVTINTSPVGIADVNDNLKVVDVTPNPASDNTTIFYGLNEASQVNIDLYDLSGKLIQHLYDGNDGAGSYVRNLNVENLTSGTYLVSTKAGNGSPVVSKLIVAR